MCGGYGEGAASRRRSRRVPALARDCNGTGTGGERGCGPGPGRRSRPASALPAGCSPREGGERVPSARASGRLSRHIPAGGGGWRHGGRTLPPGPRREDAPGGRLRQQRGPRRTHHRSPSGCGVMVSSGLPRTPPGEPGRRAPSQRRPPPQSGRPRRTGAAPGTSPPAPASPRRWTRRAAPPTRLRPGPARAAATAALTAHRRAVAACCAACAAPRL